MKKENISKTEYNSLLEFISKELKKNGLKATTMDSLATSLQMSKRTLYEIFGSKETMFKEACRFYHSVMENSVKQIFCESSNMMEAIIRSFIFNRNLMSEVNVEFIKDINEIAHHEAHNEDNKNQMFVHLENLLARGVEEGYFRSDTNLAVQCRMLAIQMESLKRMEELFPPDITLVEVYDSIMIGFLRGICSSKGLEELENSLALLNLNEKNKEYIHNEET